MATLPSVVRHDEKLIINLNLTKLISGKEVHMINHLQQSLGELGPYNSASRVHRLKTFGDEQALCFVKRDDELSFGISGSKIRKYLSLIPFLLKNLVKEAVVIGGVYSNNVLGLSQVLIENSIQPTLFLLGEKPVKPVGNFLLTSLLVPKESIQWISRADWKNVDQLAKDYADQQQHKTIIIPEGACMVEALPGALTLAVDIIRNEKQLGLQFDHIFLDAGTGLTAIATLLAFAWLKKPVTLHVVQMADGEKEFLGNLSQFKNDFEELVEQKVEELSIKERLKLYTPSTARSFGSTNRQIFQEIRRLAQEEGFLTDPIYTAKLFLTARHLVNQHTIKGNCLIVHSGGGLSLIGFQE
jgi:1-aminocyclopropane-1-carboxylate deaminase/D-cysteine desulfhydrase-like pyridoxal-dependent ACC family enzyme